MNIFSRARAGVIVLTAMVCACAPPPPAPERTVVRFMIGAPGRGIDTLTDALLREYRKSFPSLQFEVRGRSAEVSDIEIVSRGDADFAFTFADVVHTAYVGGNDWGPPAQIRGVAVLQIAPIHLVVGRHVSARSVRDLAGLRVAVGRSMTSTQIEADSLLDAYGVDRSRMHFEYLPFEQATARFLAGELDAFFVIATYPVESVRLALEAGAVLLPLDGSIVEGLRRESAFLSPTVIPAGTYPGQHESIHTLGVRNLLVCRRDLDEDLVYDLTRGFFDALPSLVSERESLRLVDLQQVPATPIPLHPGAARYYRERELER